MKKDDYKTIVVFRKFEGSIIALFLCEKYSNNKDDNSIMSYMHLGQHGAASKHLVTELEKAKPREYKDLKSELENCHGYNLYILK